MSRTWSLLIIFPVIFLEQDLALVPITAIASQLVSLLLPLAPYGLFSTLLEWKADHITLLQPSTGILKNPEEMFEFLE